MTRAELHRLAQLGAEARLEALQREISAIYATFPELRTGRSGTKRFTDGISQPVKAPVTRRRRRKMSASARKRIAEAQRKRWAEWKAKQSKTAPENQKTLVERKPRGRGGAFKKK